MALARNSATRVPHSAGGQTRPIRGLESGLPTVVGVVEAHWKIKSCDRDTSAWPSPGKPAPGSAEHGEMALKTLRRSAKKCQKFRLCGIGPARNVGAESSAKAANGRGRARRRNGQTRSACRPPPMIFEGWVVEVWILLQVQSARPTFSSQSVCSVRTADDSATGGRATWRF